MAIVGEESQECRRPGQSGEEAASRRRHHGVCQAVLRSQGRGEASGLTTGFHKEEGTAALGENAFSGTEKGKPGGS